MSDQARLFEGGGPLIPIPEGVRSRQAEWYRGANRRLGAMHGKHGHGPDGVTCGGCVHLIRKYAQDRRGGFLKCEFYNREGYEGTDWRAKWPACGAYTPAETISGRSRSARIPCAPGSPDTPGRSGS